MSDVVVHCVVDTDSDLLHVLFGGARPDESGITAAPLDHAAWITQGVDDNGRISVVTVAHATVNCAPGALPLTTANVRREYDPEVDILTVYLVDPQDSQYAPDGCLTDATGGVIYEVDIHQRLLSIEFLRASTEIHGL
ncbi:hypothetical protein pclt_cds_124 [Pandoravirus celtis]|uniref:Uncharacterized protein n=1 Tax=Pandoravirus celtis TaxID=2568002 RepID=A0A4D6EGY7_9VIRU|nr:hypothetical protein pclt_cds_124 [Pandoravirus celtis]